jgi:hypothetical protein
VISGDLAANMNKQDMIAYLLHEMPEKDREAFAERWMQDAEIHEALRLTEAELLDSYARGELSAAQGERVEACLLTSERQQYKLGIARSLRDKGSRPRRRRPQWMLRAAAVAIVALAGAILWLARQNTSLRQQTAALARTAALPSQSVYSMLLPPETREPGSTASLRLPQPAEAVRFDLELDGASGRYSAVLSTTGHAVWSVEPIETAQRGRLSIARIWIPSSVLQPGEYSIELARNGTPAGSYRFRVTPE